jgi:hypothetical protein
VASIIVVLVRDTAIRTRRFMSPVRDPAKTEFLGNWRGLQNALTRRRQPIQRDLADEAMPFIAQANAETVSDVCIMEASRKPGTLEYRVDPGKRDSDD